MSSWIFGVLAVMLALLGALVASRAIDIGMSTFGFGLVVFGIGLTLWLVKDYFDEQRRRSLT
jgi:ABC-type uncharacterized transport system permease subunit